MIMILCSFFFFFRNFGRIPDRIILCSILKRTLSKTKILNFFNLNFWFKYLNFEILKKKFPSRLLSQRKGKKKKNSGYAFFSNLWSTYISAAVGVSRCHFWRPVALFATTYFYLISRCPTANHFKASLPQPSTVTITEASKPIDPTIARPPSPAQSPSQK